MPEYLHPGVYIEEKSFRGVPIEGVSTSTAGLVGRTTKGPEGTPTLVTSFGEYQRTFGVPVAIAPGGTPAPGDYLGHAVRAFFENGGKRAYIVRALHTDAVASTAAAAAGIVPLLAPNKVLRPSTSAVEIPLVSTRGLAIGDSIQLHVRPDASSPFVTRGTLGPITALDPSRNTVTVASITAAQIGGSGAPATISAPASNLYFTAPTAPSTGTADVTGITAKYRGSAGDDISVQFRSADRSPVDVTSTVTSSMTVPVSTASGFYKGAIVEIVHATGAPDYNTIVDTDPVAKTLTLDTAMTLATTDRVRVLDLDILVYEGTTLRESFTGLTWNPAPAAASRYYVSRINDAETGSNLIRLTAPTTPDATAEGQPVAMEKPLATALWFGLPGLLHGGNDGTDLDAADLRGTDGGPGHRTGIEALRDQSDIALVAVPGVTDVSVQGALLTHCEELKYRFAILDGLPAQPNTAAMQAHRNHYDSKYGAYYAPWLKTLDLATGQQMIAPPSGYVLGICARVDNERGVWKAPANEVVRGVLDVELPFGDREQDVLNPQGINLIRWFEGRGIRVWGARCTTLDGEWKYANVRRLFIFLEHSIDRGTQWVVFEPNNESLWKRVVQTIDSFLFGVWKSGALMGTKPEDAYFVRCDRSTMTQDDIDNGRLVCEIGIAPAYPAEFVIFRIGQFTASSATA
jgi:phage tail sheath protein FI